MFAHLASLERRRPGARILIVTNAWPMAERPSYGIFIHRQVQSAIERGIECDVLHVRGSQSALAYVAAAARLLGWSLRGRPRYGLVHAHGGETALAARFYVRAPLLISYLGSDILGRYSADGSLHPRERRRAQVLRQAARLAAATITKSRGMEEVLPSSRQARNTILPSGVNRELFTPIDREAARRELGWDSDEPVALFACKPDVPNKRFHLAQAAAEVARARLGTLRLEVAWGIEPARMPLYMSAADCLIHTSVSEGSSNVIKEALACDLPVVAVPAGDAPELLAGVRGCAVCEPTPTALGSALVDTLAARERSDGRARTAWLGEDEIATRLVELYARIERPAAGPAAVAGVDGLPGKAAG